MTRKIIREITALALSGLLAYGLFSLLSQFLPSKYRWGIFALAFVGFLLIQFLVNKIFPLQEPSKQ